MKKDLDLDQDLVPEWRVKYVDYKTGKRHIKGIVRAINRLNSSSRPPALNVPATLENSKSGTEAALSVNPSRRPSNFPTAISSYNITAGHNLRDEISPMNEILSQNFPLVKPPSSNLPNDSVKDENSQRQRSNTLTVGDGQGPIRELALTHERAPSIDPISRDFATEPMRKNSLAPSRIDSIAIPRKESSQSQEEQPWNLTLVTNNTFQSVSNTSPVEGSTQFYNLRNRAPDSPKSFLSTVFSSGAPLSPIESVQTNVDIGSSDMVRQRQTKFLKWFDQEVEKVENFYKLKEDEAGALLTVLRDQLLEMRTRRVEELAEAQNEMETRTISESRSETPNSSSSVKKQENKPDSVGRMKTIFNPLDKPLLKLRHWFTSSHVGANSKALQDMHKYSGVNSQKMAGPAGNISENRVGDSIRRSNYVDNVPYRKAKRKLKLALLECYRGMEMLKSYAVLNQMALKKINKKYNRAVGAHAPMRYMSEKVNRAWFVRSNVIDSHIHVAIDLYARYFECGHHKIAFGKLRNSFARRGDESANAFRNGVLIGIGAVFSIQGLVEGIDSLHNHPEPIIRTQTSYLLQLYAGYFLALYLLAFFCLDCCIWTRNRINYQFVFEFDPSRTLDWRELASVPSFLFPFFGLCMWINFSRFGPFQMYIYYPLILIAATVIIIFFPAPVMFYRGRRWFIYSNWRLILAGLYPVEFRDFFLGDMYCSLTYVMANIEVFFCLYVNHWDYPPQCGSTHSRLLGFFTALPAVWRALQCLRRYYDTGDMFPHLVNCGKYITTILFCATLSIYRIDETQNNVIFFLFSAAINSIFVSFWDMLMDWSLLQPNSKYIFLRDVRGYRNTWWYYVVMVLNPILRFDWILYSINIHVLGHSSRMTFFVAFAEVTRRGIWAIFRVENEHCSNVARFKASRDPQLPYSTSVEPKEKIPNIEDLNTGQVNVVKTNSNILERQQSGGSTTTRRPFTKIMADAHTKDFEKRRRRLTRENSLLGSGNQANDQDSNGESSSDDGEEDESDQQVELDVAALIKERRRLAQESTFGESTQSETL